MQNRILGRRALQVSAMRMSQIDEAMAQINVIGDRY